MWNVWGFDHPQTWYVTNEQTGIHMGRKDHILLLYYYILVRVKWRLEARHLTHQLLLCKYQIMYLSYLFLILNETVYGLQLCDIAYFAIHALAIRNLYVVIPSYYNISIEHEAISCRIKLFHNNLWWHNFYESYDTYWLSGISIWLHLGKCGP